MPLNNNQHIQNRFFISNLTLEYNTNLVSDLNNLGGVEIVTAFFDYPPFVAFQRVVRAAIFVLVHINNLDKKSF